MIKQAKPEDVLAATTLAHRLWPDHEFDALKEEMRGILAEPNAAVFLCWADGAPSGFAQCQLRFDYVEGTSSSPVGYLEGIFVVEAYRKQGIAKRLLQQAEAWAKGKGCREFASDCELHNLESLSFHLAAGFLEANRVICFCKEL